MCLAVLSADNEDNGLVCLRIAFDLHKAFRPALVEQVAPFLEFARKVAAVVFPQHGHTCSAKHLPRVHAGPSISPSICASILQFAPYALLAQVLQVMFYPGSLSDRAFPPAEPLCLTCNNVAGPPCHHHVLQVRREGKAGSLYVLTRRSYAERARLAAAWSALTLTRPHRCMAAATTKACKLHLRQLCEAQLCDSRTLAMQCVCACRCTRTCQPSTVPASVCRMQQLQA